MDLEIAIDIIGSGNNHHIHFLVFFEYILNVCR